MHPLDLARHLVDAALCTLLVLVQAVIYPSFRYLPPDRLLDWHRRYTARISCFVIPLMVLQTALVGRHAIARATPADLLAFLCLIACWILTFGVSVPLHRRIRAGEATPPLLDRLVRTNWPRTVLWTAILLLGFVPAR